MIAGAKMNKNTHMVTQLKKYVDTPALVMIIPA
jgi:hypothetical protein